MGRGETWAQRKKVEARCAGHRVQANPSGHWGQGDGGAPGHKPGSLWFLLTSGSQTPLPLLKQGVLLAALHLGPLGPSCPLML